MKPFTLTELRTILPDNQENPQEQEPMYLDWGYYNWGRGDIPPEHEPFKATVSLDLESKEIYMVVEARDLLGNDIDVPPEAHTWAKEVSKPLIETLLQYEGTTNKAT
jgi:hypothetical protein